MSGLALATATEPCRNARRVNDIAPFNPQNKSPLADFCLSLITVAVDTVGYNRVNQKTPIDRASILIQPGFSRPRQCACVVHFSDRTGSGQITQFQFYPTIRTATRETGSGQRRCRQCSHGVRKSRTPFSQGRSRAISPGMGVSATGRFGWGSSSS